MYKAGIDVGSTTVKVVIFDENYQLLFSRYERHFSDVKTATIKVLNEAISEIGDHKVSIAITGSGGMGLADVAKIPFVQEVIAATTTVEKFIPQTDVVIELGGEDEGRRRRVLRIHGRPFPVRIHLHIFSLIPFRNHSENPARFIFRIRIEEPVFRFLIQNFVFEILINREFFLFFRNEIQILHRSVAGFIEGVVFTEVVFSCLATAGKHDHQ